MGCGGSKNKDVVTPVKAAHKPAADMNAKDAKELVDATKAEAAGVMAEKVTTQEKTVWKNARAEKFYKELDKDGTGKLDDKGVAELAKWSWKLMNPKGIYTCTPEVSTGEEAMKKYTADMKAKCDTNGDGVIDKKEFQEFFIAQCDEKAVLDADKIKKENEEKIRLGAAAKDKADELAAQRDAQKKEKKLDKFVNDVLPFFDTKMTQMKKTADRTIYTNLMSELMFKNESGEMDHTDRFDFPDVPHRMTILELKELVAPLVKCPADCIKEIQFYDKEGTGLIECGNDKNATRLFEAGVCDGKNIQMIKDEEKIAAAAQAKEDAAAAELAKVLATHAALNDQAGDLFTIALEKVEHSKDPMKYAIIQCWYTKKDKAAGTEETFKAEFLDLDHNTTVLEMKEKFAPTMKCEPLDIKKAKYLREPASAGFCHMENHQTLFECGLTDGNNILMKLAHK